MHNFYSHYLPKTRLTLLLTSFHPHDKYKQQVIVSSADLVMTFGRQQLASGRNQLSSGGGGSSKV